MINKLKVILTGTSNGHPSKIICRCQDCFKLICQIIESYFKACDNTPAIRDFDLSNRNLSDNPQDDLSWIREAITILTKNGTKSITAKNSFEILQELYMNATKSVENGEGGKLIAPQEDMHCSSEGHAQVQPSEQLPPLVDAGGAQTEDGTRNEVPSSPNSLFPNFPSIPENLSVWPNLVLPNLSFHGTYSSSNNTTGATSLFPNFPSIPENLSVWPNLDLPNLPFHGTYSSSHNTTGATSPDQEQILDDFFRTHPTVEVHIKGLPESLQQTLFERMATLLYHLKFVRARDFDEAARAQVQEAWNDLTGAGCELQDLEPAVNQALTAEATRRKREELTATIQACRDQLDTLPLQNPDDPFLPL
ncbi:uncharacterized protein LOC115983247 isoform X2 [Quercus lobata]|uniref:uncharacterized protein LOC115983247 isoform X2 n=1 Tax=Quercus lobata TaxID=97700 RepID=UPI00124706EE|nr:uncharacterized protein LOC115983247 isoform X2 [Quercus lobata]